MTVMLVFPLFLIGIILSTGSQARNACKNDPDFKKNTYELITSKHYPAKKYKIETSDHYVLTLFRIPNGNGYNGDNTKKPVMLLAHGLASTSSDWVVNFPNQSLGFIAYDHGYDVWLANFRGNTYSKINTKLSNKNPLFWKFSWDEMGSIDLPKMIDFILDKVNQKALYCVGHSQGTTTIMAMLAGKPEYQAKVIKAALLGPVVASYHATNIALKLSPIRDLLPLVSLPASGTYGEFFPNSIVIEALLKIVCGTKVNEVCKKIFGTFGISGPELNTSRLCVYFNHFPGGSSAYSAIHFAQQRKKLVFQKYDYGFFNYKHYGQFTPPEYNLGAVKTPIGIYSSVVDDLAVQLDIDLLRKKLGKKPYDDLVIKDIPSFTHMAFVWGLNVSDVVYSRLLQKLK